MSAEFILLFKTNYIGDAVTFLPTVAGVRQARPDAAVTLVCSSETAPLYRSTFPDIGLITIGRTKVNGLQSLRHLPALTARLRRLRPNWALLSHDEPSFCLLAALCSGAKHRVGFDLINKRLRGTLTRALAGSEGRSLVDLNFDLVRTLAGDPGLQPQRRAIGTGPADVAVAERKLREFGIDPGRPLVLLHPFAKFAFKQWPLERFAALAARLRERGAEPVILSAEPIAGFEAPAISGLSLTELSALCAKAKLFIGNNSGPMHIAAAMGTPTLVLQGPSPMEWNIPWLPTSLHRYAAISGLACQPCDRLGAPTDHCANLATPLACLDRLGLDQVFAAAVAILDERCSRA